MNVCVNVRSCVKCVRARDHKWDRGGDTFLYFRNQTPQSHRVTSGAPFYDGVKFNAQCPAGRTQAAY